MKKILVLLLCLEFTLAFGQTKFDNERLMLVQDIYHNTTKQKLDSFMSIQGYKVGEFIKGDDYFGDTYLYNSNDNKIQIEYDLNNKISSVIFSYAGKHNNTITEMRLREARYSYKEDEYTNEGIKFTRKVWSKPNSNFSFITFVDKDQDIGVLGYGIFIE